MPKLFSPPPHPCHNPSFHFFSLKFSAGHSWVIALNMQYFLSRHNFNFFFFSPENFLELLVFHFSSFALVSFHLWFSVFIVWHTLDSFLSQDVTHILMQFICLKCTIQCILEVIQQSPLIPEHLSPQKNPKRNFTHEQSHPSLIDSDDLLSVWTCPLYKCTCCAPVQDSILYYCE